MRYLDNLNTSQREAVTAPLGPVSVLAGPGSGKTRVLTNRIQHLFYNHNIAPPRIRAVTFTQNGTKTMRERLNKDGVRMFTFPRFTRSVAVSSTSISNEIRNSSHAARLQVL